jgi:arylsulfatase A-like enzyme
MIDEIVGALRTRGILEDTVILFTSDNGFHFGEHRLNPGKSFAYEEDIRIPLLVRGPGFPEATTRSELVLNLDLAPTIADLAGAAVPEFVDGRSLLPLFEPRSHPDWRRCFLIEREALEPERFFGPAFAAIRTERYKYVAWDDGETELYDLWRDPFEMDSLHDFRERGTMRAFLARQLRELRRCEGEACRAAEDMDLFRGRPFHPRRSDARGRGLPR